jgi:hypothetical protein
MTPDHKRPDQRCPRCGSERGVITRVFACGSLYVAIGEPSQGREFEQSRGCLEAERAAVYAAYKGCPPEQVAHIPLAQFVSTRYVTVEEHNRALGELEQWRRADEMRKSRAT